MSGPKLSSNLFDDFREGIHDEVCIRFLMLHVSPVQHQANEAPDDDFLHGFSDVLKIVYRHARPLSSLRLRLFENLRGLHAPHGEIYGGYEWRFQAVVLIWKWNARWLG